MRKGRASCHVAGYPSFGMPLFLFQVNKIIIIRKNQQEEASEGTVFKEYFELGFNENSYHPNTLTDKGKSRIINFLEKELSTSGLVPTIMDFRLVTGLYIKQDERPYALFCVQYECAFKGFERQDISP